MSFITVLQQISIIVFFIVTGYTIKKTKLISATFDTDLTNFVLYLTLPSLIITSMQNEYASELSLKIILIMIGLSLAMYTFSYVLSLILLKILPLKKDSKRVFQFMIIFSNCGFMGYPVVKVIFGDEGLIYAIFYNLSFNILIWTLGVYIISRNDFKPKKIINPGLIATAVGLIIFGFSLKIPAILNNSLSMIGQTTIPLSMITVGCILADSRIKKAFNPNIAVLIIVRLFAIPLIFFLILKFMDVTRIQKGVAILISGMPAAATTAIFAKKYGANSELASNGIFLTTIVSLVTIPIIALLI